jgi:hypothetical protein
MLALAIAVARRSGPVVGHSELMAAAVAAHSMAQLRYYPAVSTGRSVNRTESPVQKMRRFGNVVATCGARACGSVPRLMTAKILWLLPTQ